MRQCPDFLTITKDHVVVRVEVAVPWLRERLCYDHAFDTPDLREEFGPIPEPMDHVDLFRRSELMQKRTRSVEALAHTIARSILHALDRQQK